MIGHTKVSGPLAVLADGFRTELDRVGYTPSSREFKLAEVARLSAWLEGRGLGARDSCSARLEEFLADLAAAGSGRSPTLVAMRPLLGWLRDRGLCGDDPPPARGPLDELMARYRHWLVTDRQFASRTISRYEQGARLWLRAAEVAGLELDDFDWRVGELVVHGKAGRCDRMPLPAAVGEAVVAYLLEARPSVV